MKHKPESISVPKLVSKFTPPCQTDRIVGLFRDLKESTSKLILFSHFELIIFQLSQNSLPDDCVIQRVLSESLSTLYQVSFQFPRYELESLPLSSRYLVNGKFMSEELEVGGIGEVEEGLTGIAEEIVRFLGKASGSILSCTLEFLKDRDGFYLLDILKVREGVLLAGKEVVSCVSESVGRKRGLSRPVTSRSGSKSFIFTHQEVDTSASMFVNNITTPRCFKLSYEFPNKVSQTVPSICCPFVNSIASLKQSIQQAQHQQYLLSVQLASAQKDNDLKLQALESKWKEKCLKLSQSLANRKINEQKRSNSRPRAMKRLMI